MGVNNAEEQIKIVLFNFLKNQGNLVRESRTMSLEDKIIQTDIILDTMKFLNNYQENAKILNEHRLKENASFKKPFEKKGDEER